MPHSQDALLQSEMTPVQVALLRMNIYACVDVLSEMLSMSVCQNVAVFSGMAFIHAPYNFLLRCFWSWEKLGSKVCEMAYATGCKTFALISRMNV